MGISQAAASFLSKSGRAALSLGAAAFGLGAAATAVNSSLYTVDVGHRAVVFNRIRGILEETIGEGTHFLIPWVQKPYIFDIRTRPHTFSSISGTKDLQMVNLTLRVLSRPDTQCLPTIVQNLGLEYDEKVLPSLGNEILKAVVAQFNADQLLTQRPQVSALVRDRLVRRAKDFNILLDDVAITHLSYDPEFYRKQEHKRQANEEKIMQREREKERIEAGKKLLQAQRIAEENERKRFLALRKAAEEKRAWENILKKLEQDKERIEAGKKLLEAKRIAEENERKRILAVRKAAKEEEEKRVKENILKKLEQDKERIEADKKLHEAKRIAEENERKRILGLRKAAAAEGERRARENIRKKLEQEKERIEADKKLHEAKRIAEENERKRILGLRKAAAAEEERRARENILKKLEQDKERIEADKKLLEAKRIAEENERKRILGLRKAAAAEEERRARENILKKLEQDKLNRRSELGLPLEGQATVRSPAIAVKQEKISKPVYTTTKVEHLRECLRSLKRQHQDENERVQRAFETLLVYVGNVVKNPMEEKYRKIRLSNPSFRDRVGSLKGGVEFLELCGFERTGDFLYLPHEKVDMELLTKAGYVLNSAMTNPFFGLLSKDS